MPLSLRKGDLFTSGLTALAHGCNCQGVMDAGIAFQFRERWPHMYADYQYRCTKGLFRLGGIMTWEAAGFRPVKTVFNLGTQDQPGPNARLDAVAVSVSKMLLVAEAEGIPVIGMPQVGCGIGGLQWADVGYLLELLSGRSPVELIVYEYEPQHG